MRARSTRNSNQILRGDQTRCEDIFTGSTTPPTLAKIFGDMNADARDLFSAANRLVDIAGAKICTSEQLSSLGVVSTAREC